MPQSHYVQIPKDFNEIRQKFMFNLTKRQVVSFGIGAVTGMPVFFLIKMKADLSLAVTGMGIAAAPAVFCGIYKKNGLYFEQVFRNMVNFFKSPRKRVYRSLNIFKSVDMQIESFRLQRLLNKSEGGKKR